MYPVLPSADGGEVVEDAVELIVESVAHEVKVDRLDDYPGPMGELRVNVLRSGVRTAKQG